MTKAELIERIARSRDLPADMTKKCVAEVVDVAFGELAAYFARAKVTRSQNPRFTFPGFGTFTKKKRSARRGVNPRTLEPIEIDACVTLDFRPGRELRSAMNRGRTSRSGEKDHDDAATRTGRSRGRSTRVDGGSGGEGTRAGAQRGSKRRKGGARGKSASKSAVGRKLTPRDDDGAIVAASDGGSFHDELGAELPSASLQRVRPGERGSTRRRVG
jgi:DNA-binding protein HU-beta